MKKTLVKLISLSCALVVASSQAALVAYYTFDADNAADTSGNSNDGTVGASVVFSADVSAALVGGKSASFDGASFITAATSASLQSINDALTVSFWVKTDTSSPTWFRIGRMATGGSGAQGWLVTRNNAESDLLIRYDTLPDDSVSGKFNQNTHMGQGLGVLDNAWHHVVYTASNGTSKEYIDGDLKDTASYFEGNGFSNTRPLEIGGTSANYSGLLDEVAIWDYAISDADVALLATGAPATSVPEPATLALLGFGLVAVSLLRRRR